MLTSEQRLAMLEPPKGMVDLVIDSDTYNEIDDQFAIAYALLHPDRLNVKAIYAAPFLNQNAASPEEGMLRSEQEIHKLLGLLKMEREVFAGSRQYLPDEKTPVISPAAQDLAQRAMAYSPENPLYIVAIGAITNIASALLINPAIADRVVIVWLGGHDFGWMDINEFNLRQDIAAGRVVYQSGAPLVMMPAQLVTSKFATTGPELRYWMSNKNALCDYLMNNVLDAMEKKHAGTAWSRTIWDVTGMAWPLGGEGKLVWSRLIPTPLPGYDLKWEFPEGTPLCRYVFHIYRDNLFTDLFVRLGGASLG